MVGPVYTFVKTDYDGHVQLGRRHVVGKKYARGGKMGNHTYMTSAMWY